MARSQFVYVTYIRTTPEKLWTALTDAEFMGQQAAANILGADEAFADVPFFWTHHQGLDLRYCGYAGKWDEVRIDGNLQSKEFTARYYRGGKLVAAASLGRDHENLQIEEQLRG